MRNQHLSLQQEILQGVLFFGGAECRPKETFETMQTFARIAIQEGRVLEDTAASAGKGIGKLY
jgi:hypothetical protein